MDTNRESLSNYLERVKRLAVASMEALAKSGRGDFLGVLDEGRVTVGEEAAVVEEEGRESVMDESGPPAQNSPALGQNIKKITAQTFGEFLHGGQGQAFFLLQIFAQGPLGHAQ